MLSFTSDSQDWKKNAVRVRLCRVIVCRYETHQTVILREINGNRELSLLISYAEAVGIERKFRREYFPRPFTHDLFCQAVSDLGGRFLDTIIYDTQGGVYYAKLRIRQDERILTLDSRPSDAIAVALCSRPPLDIYVDTNLMKVKV